MKQVLNEAAVRDYIKAEKQRGRRLTWVTAQAQPEFKMAIETLERFGRMKRKTATAKKAATEALKILGRLSKGFRGIYF